MEHRPGRKLAAALAATLWAALTLGLAGCIKFEGEIAVEPDDTIAVTYTVAYEDAFLEEMAAAQDITVAELLESADVGAQLQNSPGFGDSFTVADYAAEGYTGWVLASTENQPLNDLSEPIPGYRAGELKLRHEGEQFILSGSIDLTGSQFDLPSAYGDSPEVARWVESAEVKLIFVFPGPIESASGAIDANSVTFSCRVGEVTEVSAVAAAEPKATWGVGMWLIVGGAAFLLVVAAVLIGVLAGRRRRRREAEAPAGPVYPADGFGPLPAAPGSAPELSPDPGPEPQPPSS
ncbi:MAG: hypothetical protein LBD77_08185 [Bifidobacteriaceae bacterium]|jgi:hypothetical protein|nr:hypothetical protein [Bifidobacteriaceae bacterium]